MYVCLSELFAGPEPPHIERPAIEPLPALAKGAGLTAAYRYGDDERAPSSVPEVVLQEKIPPPPSPGA